MSLFGLYRGRDGEKRARRVTAGALFHLEGWGGGVFVKEWLCQERVERWVRLRAVRVEEALILARTVATRDSSAEPWV